MDSTILFYIFTFLFGLYIDRYSGAKIGINKIKSIFVIWLYIFLCFGYTTGSDWRPYEISFNNLNFEDIDSYNKEKGFWYVFWFIKQIIPDFWLTLGIMKSFYFYSLIKLFRKITPYWISSIMILMPLSLTFMLIDNPLRFMCALIFINFGLFYLFDKKYWIFVLLVSLSILFHETSVFFILFLPFFLLTEKIYNVNRILIFSIYLLLTLLSYNINNLTYLFNYIMENFSLVSENKFESYGNVDNSNFFSIGVFIKILFLILILLTKPIIDDKKYGKYIYVFTILNIFFDRFFAFIPTVFRLSIPFGYFFAIYVASLLNKKHIFGYFFFLYYITSFPLTIWNSWKMIPYTNSIPYILTEHKPYQERSSYNIIKYQERTGKYIFNYDY